MDTSDCKHPFGQSTSNVWPMCILVERRMWYEPINVMENSPERGRHFGGEGENKMET